MALFMPRLTPNPSPSLTLVRGELRFTSECGVIRIPLSPIGREVAPQSRSEAGSLQTQ